MRIDRVNDRLLNADGKRPSNLREPRIPSVPVPGDDKIHQPTQIELWINIKTAGAIGVEIPLQLQQLAERLIE
jgi:hypothetical protein